MRIQPTDITFLSRTTDADTHNVRTLSCSYEHLWKTQTEMTDIDIDEVTRVKLLSKDTSLTTEKIMLLNSKVNLDKYKHPC